MGSPPVNNPKITAKTTPTVWMDVAMMSAAERRLPRPLMKSDVPAHRADKIKRTTVLSSASVMSGQSRL